MLFDFFSTPVYSKNDIFYRSPFSDYNKGYIRYNEYIDKDQNSLVIEFSLPGVKKECVNLSFDTDSNSLNLTVKENKESKPTEYITKGFDNNIERSVSIVIFKDIAIDSITAEFDNGLMKVYLPMVEKKVTEKEIKIK